VTAAHQQVQVEGVYVDEALAPLLQSLWRRGMRTQFSCQGDWSVPGYTLGNGSKETARGLEQWAPYEEDVDRASYILFDQISDAARFFWSTINLLTQATSPEDCVLSDAQLKLEAFDPDGGGGIRGCVRFHSALLDTIQTLWLAAPMRTL
jgi:hypothetical protein